MSDELERRAEEVIAEYEPIVVDAENSAMREMDADNARPLLDMLKELLAAYRRLRGEKTGKPE